MLYCSNYTLTLSDFSDISQVLIAIVNFGLACYIFFYQIRKDRKSELATAKINEQNIKLQWFKELIVQPNLHAIQNFYSQIQTIKNKITSNDLSEEEKQQINNFIKAEMVILRKSFVDVLLQIDNKLATTIMENLDNLVDGITNSIFNDELKLKNHVTYEKYIGGPISYSKNNLIATLYNYKGVE